MFFEEAHHVGPWPAAAPLHVVRGLCPHVPTVRPSQAVPFVPALVICTTHTRHEVAVIQVSTYRKILANTHLVVAWET